MQYTLSRRAALLIISDIVITFVSYLLAIWLTGQWGALFVTTDVLFTISVFCIINLIVFTAFHLYSGLWEFAGAEALMQVSIAGLIASLLGAVVSTFMTRLPIRVYVVAVIILICGIGVVRLSFRYVYRYSKRSSKTNAQYLKPRTLIVGAGETGAMCIKRMESGDFRIQGIPVIAVDDDQTKLGMRIHGVKVMGTRHDILRLCKDYDIHQIVVAILSANTENSTEIFEICSKTDCKLLTLPDIKDMRIADIGDIALREVNINDLLGRDEIVMDPYIVASYISHKTVLVTGAGGSIGSELVRQLVAISPAQIILFDIYENGIFDLRGELLEKYPHLNLRVEVGSIRDKERIEHIFKQYQPQVVFHAAAHKHVPLMEICPREALKNNVLGLKNMVESSQAHGVERFIFISTDKAVNPVNIMGATKRMGELIIQAAAQSSHTIFTAVRFGNVLGSNGSVIPIFKRQLAAGGPLTVTHPDIVRYFMTIPEAARLVIQAGGMACGGEIFILNMGKPVKIIDLARNMIRLAGLEPDKDIEIKICGLRPGEKLYEELVMDTEEALHTSNKDIMCSQAALPNPQEIQAYVERLEQLIHQDNDQLIWDALEECVPTFKPSRQDITW